MNREKFLEQKLKELTNLLFLYEVRHRAQGHLLSSEIYQFAEFYLTCAPNPSRPKVDREQDCGVYGAVWHSMRLCLESILYYFKEKEKDHT